MGEMDIAFPNLGIYLTNVPKTIMIGNFGIALYGVVIAIGMILGLTLSSKIAARTGQDLGSGREPYYLLDHRREDLLCDLHVGLLQE